MRKKLTGWAVVDDLGELVHEWKPGLIGYTLTPVFRTKKAALYEAQDWTGHTVVKIQIIPLWRTRTNPK